MSGLTRALTTANAVVEDIDSLMSLGSSVRSLGKVLSLSDKARLRTFNEHAARMLQRKYRSKAGLAQKRRKLSHQVHAPSKSMKGIFIGSPSPCKKTQIAVATNSAPAGRALSITNLSQIARVTNLASGLDIDRRVTDLIHLSGVKLQIFHQNAVQDVYGLNYAVVVCRNEQTISPTLPVAQFFGGNSNVRGEAFDTTKTGVELHCLPLNTDKFEVLWHKRVILGSSGGAVTGINDYKPWHLLDTYVPINREIRYTSQDATSAVSYPILMVWCDRLSSQSGSAGDADVGIRNTHITAYWREKQ